MIGVYVELEFSYQTLGSSDLLGRTGGKNHKTFINFVSTIIFFFFPVHRKFWYQIVACCVWFLMIC